MKIKKGIALLISLLLLVLICACGENETPKSEYIGADELAAGVEPGSLGLYISEKNEIGAYMGWGAEVDPYFLSFVGQPKHTGEGESHTVAEEDWNSYILTSMQEM
ncbi:MAG: hypothetical protein IJF71_01985, partial [Clostridia bacterium]|nr:hypothetical protein [Clostridia bacterium]